MAGADSYTTRNRYRKQYPGNNLNQWGVIVNAVFDRMEESKDGFLKLTFSGGHTLLVGNDTSDEAHFGVLDYSGPGGTLTLPGFEKTYIGRNGGTGTLTLTTGAGRTLDVAPTVTCGLICDAVNVDLVTDPSARAYTDAKVLAAYAGVLPGGATDGTTIFSQGGAATWRLVQLSDVQGLADALDQCIAFAAAL